MIQTLITVIGGMYRTFFTKIFTCAAVDNLLFGSFYLFLSARVDFFPFGVFWCLQLVPCNPPLLNQVAAQGPRGAYADSGATGFYMTALQTSTLVPTSTANCQLKH